MNNAQKTIEKLTQDLQAAQREVEIEAALERVRSRSLAMEGTNELSEVAGMIYREVDGLGLKPLSASIFVRDEEGKTARIYELDVNGQPMEVFENLEEAYEYGPIKAGIEAARAAGRPYYHRHMEGPELTAFREETRSTIKWTGIRSRSKLNAVDVYWFIFDKGSLILPFEGPLAES